MLKDETVRKIILDIVEKIKEDYQPDKIIFFGPYAYRKPTEDSDIDLLIVKRTNQRPIDRRVKVRKLVYDPGSNKQALRTSKKGKGGIRLR